MPRLSDTWRTHALRVSESDSYALLFLLTLTSTDSQSGELQSQSQNAHARSRSSEFLYCLAWDFWMQATCLSTSLYILFLPQSPLSGPQSVTIPSSKPTPQCLSPWWATRYVRAVNMGVWRSGSPVSARTIANNISSLMSAM